jgi:hypothetical protein
MLPMHPPAEAVYGAKQAETLVGDCSEKAGDVRNSLLWMTCFGKVRIEAGSARGRELTAKMPRSSVARANEMSPSEQ